MPEEQPRGQHYGAELRPGGMEIGSQGQDHARPWNLCQLSGPYLNVMSTTGVS